MLAVEPDMAHTDIAKRLGVSKQRVHQVLKGFGKTKANSGSALGHRVEYRCWHNMIARCIDDGRANFRHYGGRGIGVCDRWLHSFPAFLADMGSRPSPAHSINRINNDGNYEPGNCRWATKAEQLFNRRNTKAPRVRYVAPGQPTKITPEVRAIIERELAAGKSVPQAAEAAGIAESTLRKWWKADDIARARSKKPKNR